MSSQITRLDADLNDRGRFSLRVRAKLGSCQLTAELRALCVHVLVHALFVHTWSNDRQYAYG
jgi:hypothetical protein